MKSWEAFLKVKGWSSEYSSVHRVLRHYGRRVRSERTRENFCISLMLFCKYCGLDPESLVTLDSEEVSRLCQDFTDQLRDKEYSLRYVNVNQSFLKTFFKKNGFEGERRIRVERYFQPTRYRKKPEYIPTQDEIHRMGYSAGSVKNTAIILMLYTAGLRNSTLRALRYKDVKEEMEKGLDIVKIPVYQEMKTVDSGACKGNIPYYSFINPETSNFLRKYLEERRQLFENIDEEEPLFCSNSNQVPLERQPTTPVSKNGLDRMVKRVAKQAGIEKWKDVTPKCLRKAFESALRNNGLDPKDQEFLMGHILPGTQDPYYDSSKVEDLREKYAKIRFFKTTEVNKLDMIKTFAQTLGIENIEIKIQKMKEKQDKMDEMDVLGKIIRKELGIQPLETSTTRKKKTNRKNNPNNPQRNDTRIITEDKLVTHLNEGWNLIKELNNGKLIIKKES